MISDERLKEIAAAVPVQGYDSAYITLGDIHEMVQELLSRREAERKAKSWDDTEAYVQTRRKVTEFYDNTGRLRGKFYGEPEERPK